MFVFFLLIKSYFKNIRKSLKKWVKKYYTVKPWIVNIKYIERTYQISYSSLSDNGSNVADI